eukprot:CAMPEP_0184652300 /NCGR_PEP_ID=MMETSP0308-20130426/10003_1 /TAXON_ID=38269 /ORGANISM="Gloeochaete witrockiana, Strain SAG 46.84" /LENGTH=185 /DNA_ID=CAMNT_0027087101 /DNA_START=642 /DNA_END=1197 /DNA_ORIENTATION=+
MEICGGPSENATRVRCVATSASHGGRGGTEPGGCEGAAAGRCGGTLQGGGAGSCRRAGKRRRAGGGLSSGEGGVDTDLKGVLDLNVSGVLLVTLAVFVRRGVRDEIGATALLRRDAVLVCMGNKVRVLVRLYKVPEGDGEVAPVWVRTGEGVLDVNLMGKALLDNKVCVRVRMVVEAVQRRVLVR